MQYCEYTHLCVHTKVGSDYMESFQVGFSFLLDCSGRLFEIKKKPVAMRDVEGNCEAIFAVMVVSKGAGRYSAHLLQQAITLFYTECALFPPGLSSDMEVIQTWALKQGNALQKLVSWLKECLSVYTSHICLNIIGRHMYGYKLYIFTCDVKLDKFHIGLESAMCPTKHIGVLAC